MGRGEGRTASYISPKRKRGLSGKLSSLALRASVARSEPDFRPCEKKCQLQRVFIAVLFQRNATFFLRLRCGVELAFLDGAPLVSEAVFPLQCLHPMLGQSVAQRIGAKADRVIFNLRASRSTAASRVLKCNLHCLHGIHLMLTATASPL